ncbi:hypothetical protein BCR39DRAFT_541424 [Naematelia encephala]|uniref:Uncharacterized protein n=1 Tax=Naematelia encephala TaxID=71784 RepID=A0A1Y2AUS5_9TREE|nr:hypothetical protein BCR39DRAFT_541424 [Naematelia encephala]
MPELYDPQRNQALPSGTHIGPPQPPPAQSSSILEQPLIHNYDSSMSFDIPSSFPYHGRKFKRPVGQAKEGVDPSWLDAEGRNEDPLLQPGAGLSATADLFLDLLKLEPGSYADYEALAEAHFDESGRFQLLMPSPTSATMYNIAASSVARFFDTMVMCHLTRHVLSLPTATETILWSAPDSPMSVTDEPPPPINSNPRHGIRVACEDMIWTIGSDLGGSVEWRGRLSAVWIPVLEEGVLRLETLEVEVEDWSQTGKIGCTIDEGLPEIVHRVLHLVVEMEDMESVIQLAEQNGIRPNQALGIVTDSTGPDQVRIVDEDGQEEPYHEMS